jgi:hypothetical protein
MPNRPSNMSGKQAPAVVSWDDSVSPAVAESPMKIFKSNFWFLRTFGFPFLIEDGKATRFSDNRKLLKTVLFNFIPIVIANCAIGTALLQVISYISSADELFALAYSIGLKKWDMYSMAILFLPLYTSPIAFYYSYGSVAERLTKFVRQSEKLQDPPSSKDVHELALKYLRKKLAVAYFLSFVVTAAHVVSYFIMYRHSENKEVTMTDGYLTMNLVGVAIILYHQVTSPIGTGNCLFIN